MGCKGSKTSGDNAVRAKESTDAGVKGVPYQHSNPVSAHQGGQFNMPVQDPRFQGV